MDACHVLLRIPWLLDRKVLHDGMENTYEFNKYGHCYMLELMEKGDITTIHNSDDGCSGSKSGNIMLYLAKDFLKENKKENLCLSIILKKVKRMRKSVK